MFDDLQAEAVRPDIRWVALLYGDLPPAAFVHYDQFPVDVFFWIKAAFSYVIRVPPLSLFLDLLWAGACPVCCWRASAFSAGDAASTEMD